MTLNNSTLIIDSASTGFYNMLPISISTKIVCNGAICDHCRRAQSKIIEEPIMIDDRRLYLCTSCLSTFILIFSGVFAHQSNTIPDEGRRIRIQKRQRII